MLKEFNIRINGENYKVTKETSRPKEEIYNFIRIAMLGYEFSSFPNENTINTIMPFEELSTQCKITFVKQVVDKVIELDNNILEI